MKCPYCNEENLIDAKFCAECGRPLSGDIPSYMLHEDEDLWEKVKEFTGEIKKSLTEKNYKRLLSDRNNPVTNMVIVFIAWLLLRTVGILPFIIIVRILAFLMGYVGLFFLMVVTYVYSTHREEIEEKVEELRGVDYKKTLREIVDSFAEDRAEAEKEKEEDSESEEK